MSSLLLPGDVGEATGSAEISAASSLKAAFVICVEGFNDTHAFTADDPESPVVTSESSGA